MGWSGFSFEDVMRSAARASGLRTAEAICDALARTAIVIKNDDDSQPRNDLLQYRVFAEGIFKDADSLTWYFDKYGFTPITEQNALKNELLSSLNSIKNKSKPSTDATKKAEDKQERKNNLFPVGSSGMTLQYQTKKKGIDEQHLNDAIYVDLNLDLIPTLQLIVSALRNFSDDMDKDGYEKVVFFKKHTPIVDDMSRHIETIMECMKKLMKKGANVSVPTTPTMSKSTSKSNSKSKSKSAKAKSTKTKSTKAKSKSTSAKESVSKSTKSKSVKSKLKSSILAARPIFGTKKAKPKIAKSAKSAKSKSKSKSKSSKSKSAKSAKAKTSSKSKSAKSKTTKAAKQAKPRGLRVISSVWKKCKKLKRQSKI